MGSIDFQSWNAAIDDIQALNREPEISRLRLVFEDFGGGAVSAGAAGNVSIYYLVIGELLAHLEHGAFTCEVTSSTGERRNLQITTGLVMEDGKDISRLFF